MADLEIALVSPYAGRNSERIASVTDSALNWYTARLAAAMAPITRLTVIGPFSGDRCWRDGCVDVLGAYARGSALAPLQIMIAAMRSRARIVHFQHELFAFGGLMTALGLPLAMRAVQYSGRKTVATIHGVIPLDSIDSTFVRRNGSRVPASIARAGWRALLRGVCSASNLVLVHEAEHRRVLREEYGVRQRVEVVPHGVPLSEPVSTTERSRARNRFRIGGDAEVLTFFGYLAGYKGLDEFFDVVPELLSDRPCLHVVVAGEAPARLAGSSRLVDRLAQLAQIHDRVHRLGFVPDSEVRDVFAASDVLVLPYTCGISASGPLSLSVGYGVPVLLSRHLSGSPNGAVAFDPTPHGIRLAVNAFFDDERTRRAAAMHMTTLRAERCWPAVARLTTDLYHQL